MITLFLLTILFMRISYLVGINLLILGDSIDRYITLDFCDIVSSEYSTSQSGWGDGGIRYRNKKNGWIIPALRCITSVGDTISFVHTFGSPAKGPYHMGLRNHPEDPYADTDVRIPRVFELYIKEFTVIPDRVLFHTNMWDLPDEYRHGDRLTRDSIDWTTTLYAFRKQTLERIDQIRDIVNGYTMNSSRIDIMIRTAAWEESGGKLLHVMNDMIRNISTEYNLTLFDLDYDAWSTVQFNYSRQSSVIRDNIHPYDFITGPAGQKLLGRRYSAYLHYKGNMHSNHISTAETGTICQNTTYSSQYDVEFKPFHLEKLHHLFNCSNYVIKLIDTQNYKDSNSAISTYLTRHNHVAVMSSIDWNKLYYYIRRDGHDFMYGKISEAFISRMFLSYGDIFKLDHAAVTSLNIINLGEFPSDIVFDDSKLIAITPSKKIYLRLENTHKFRQIPNYDTLNNFFQVSNDSKLIHYNTDAGLINDMLLPPFPDIYRNNTLIRYHADKQVYVVRQGQKWAIPSIQIFVKYGYEFSDVIPIMNKEDIDIIPFGGDLD